MRDLRENDFMQDDADTTVVVYHGCSTNALVDMIVVPKDIIRGLGRDGVVGEGGRGVGYPLVEHAVDYKPICEHFCWICVF